MAQQFYRTNLSASTYPLAISRSAGSVIIPGPDQNYDRRVDPVGETSSPGIPQAIYLENVIPTKEGYKSVGYQNMDSLPWEGEAAILEIKSTKSTFSEILALRVGSLTAVRWNGSTWTSVGVVGGTGAPNFGPTASFAIVRGAIYIFDGDNLWLYNLSGTSYPYAGVLNRVDGITLTTGSVTPAGAMTNLVAITSSFGYLVFLKDDGAQVQILWSSLITPTDFTPSLSTGAGGGAVADCQGRAATVRPTDSGFYVYNTNNVIVAAYTGNSRFPFRFKPVSDAPGVVDVASIYGDIDEGLHYYTTKQGWPVALQGDKAAYVAPEFCDYMLSSREVDSFNYITNLFSTQELPDQNLTPTACYVFEGRYLCVSLLQEELTSGIQPFNVVYVYDLQLNRYGKLKVDHTQIITFHAGVNTGFLGFVNTRDGTTKLWNLNEALAGLGNYEEMKGVLLLGRLQYVRARTLIFQELRVSKAETANFSVVYYPTQNSLNFLTPVIPYYSAAESSSSLKRYFSMTEGRNISVLFKGGFDISLVEIVFTLGGNI